MKLRFSSIPALLAATLVCSTVPAAAQSKGSNAFANERSPYPGKVVEEIVARVNDQVISLSDYNRAVADLRQEAQQQGWTEQEFYEQRRDLLRSLIDKQLLLSEGKQLGITGDTGMIRRLDEMRKQYHLASMDALEKAAEAQGVNWEDLKEQIRENIITSDVISQEVAPKIDVTPSEIRAYYDAHRSEFEEPEKVRLSEILIPTPNPDDAAQVSTAEKKADDIERRLKAGADFAAIAKADSSGPTASEGGDLGEYKKGVLPKVMEDATFDREPGQWTQPIRTKQGWLILKVTQHVDAGQEPLSEAQNQIQETLGMQKLQPALRAYLTQLRNEAYITIRPGYEDSGASPDEMKFIQSAYVPPGPKHRKHHRARFRMKPVHERRQKTETASSGIPAGVPTLNEVNQDNGRTQKPGKREKIRFGQAPRETLPPAPTRQVNAGAGQQQATASEPSGVTMTDASGNMVDNGEEQPKKHVKQRFQDQKKLPKAKRWKNRKKQKYVAPKPSAAVLAKEQRESQAYGLQGDTAHKKKVNPAKEGPKRRFSNEDRKKKHEKPPASGTTGTPAGTAPATQGNSTGSTQQ